ncbi:MAG: branched-chain amino acid transporter permease [Clostridiales bacterium]|nr:branched-chain amino acid transporter permease [Clostridiales bacterium]
MLLTNTQTLIMILAIAAGTMITRFTPFLLFPEKKEVPKYIVYLGKVLPPAMMGLLVVYCFKGISILKGSHGIPEAIATIVTILLHKWKSNVLVSIAGGTVCYMLLVQLIFK